ncbi:MAG: hypothetical protein IT428_27425 [Planctomycetaceae bacterium]|nr:hypothetical protein [Planctomycetaceae bacterium]
MPPRARLVFGDGFVEKSYPASVLDVEYEKQCAVWNVLGGQKGIALPQPLDIDRAAGNIRFTRVPADGTLADLYRRFLCRDTDDDGFLRLLDVAARSLAAMHCGLALSSRTEWTPPACFDEAATFGGFAFPSKELKQSRHAWLHCDFGFANLSYRRTAAHTQQLVIYDPSPNEHTTLAADQYGPVEVDLGCLFASLNGRFPVRQYPRVRWSRIAQAKEQFLSCYEAASGWTVNRTLVEAVGYATAFASLSRWRGRGLRRRLGMTLLYNRFKNNIHWMKACHDSHA